MTRYVGTCQALGFLCDWQSSADSRQAVVSGLGDHLNAVHGTGSTSPALDALIERYVSDARTGGTSKPTHAKERSS